MYVDEIKKYDDPQYNLKDDIYEKFLFQNDILDEKKIVSGRLWH